jgi:Flp pilus assembly pilin Flp
MKTQPKKLKGLAAVEYAIIAATIAIALIAIMTTFKKELTDTYNVVVKELQKSQK